MIETKQIFHSWGAMVFSLCWVFGMTLCDPNPAFPQSPSGASVGKGPLQIIHHPPRIKDLPEPGRPMKLMVSIKNTRNTNLTLRLLTVTDDQFQDLAFRGAYLNEYDHPTYELNLLAPLAEMQYQLLLVDNNGEIIASPAYQLSRSCLPNIDAADLTNDSNMSLKEKAPLQVERAAKLEKELTAYDTALKLATELREMVKAE